MTPTVLCALLLLAYAWSLITLRRIEAQMRFYYLLDCDLALDLASTKHAYVPHFGGPVPSPKTKENGDDGRQCVRQVVVADGAAEMRKHLS
jgi:hypothetical protein